MGSALKRILEHGWEWAGITGILTPEDIEFIKQYAGKYFILFHVYVSDSHLKNTRLSQRNSQRDHQSYGDFLQQDSTEFSLFKPARILAE